MKFTGYPPVVEYLENGKDLFYDNFFYNPDTRMYRPNYHPLLNEQQPNQNSYFGKLYVMVNGASGSMASVVTSILRENTRAIFIGEESGGNNLQSTNFLGEIFRKSGEAYIEQYRPTIREIKLIRNI